MLKPKYSEAIKLNINAPIPWFKHILLTIGEESGDSLRHQVISNHDIDCIRQVVPCSHQVMILTNRTTQMLGYWQKIRICFLKQIQHNEGFCFEDQENVYAVHYHRKSIVWTFGNISGDICHKIIDTLHVSLYSFEWNTHELNLALRQVGHFHHIRDALIFFYKSTEVNNDFHDSLVVSTDCRHRHFKFAPFVHHSDLILHLHLQRNTINNG